MITLTDIAKHHALWIDFTARFCNDYHYVPDLVQEMYLRCDGIKDKSKLERDGELNKSYIFAILRNLCTDYHRAKQRVIKTDLEEVTDVYFDEEEADYTYEVHETHQKIRTKLKKESHYYELMYLTYTSADNPSMRDIANGTGISIGSVFHDIKKIKEIINDE